MPLSKLTIRAQTLLDNPIPMKQNKIDMAVEVDDQLVNAYKEATAGAREVLASKIKLVLEGRDSREVSAAEE